VTQRVCVVGANGYLGRHIAQSLSADPALNSLHLCDLQAESIDHHAQYTQVDLRSAKSVGKIVQDSDFIFFFAGLTGTAQGFAAFRDFVEINEIGLLNLLNACRELSHKPKIIFPSTRLVYKGKKDVALKEDDEKEFKTIYALNKYAGEQYLGIYADYFGVKYTVFRICVPYGTLLPGSLSYGTLSHFVSQSKSGEVVVFGDGLQKRTFVNIGDLVRILLTASFSPLTDNGIFNIGGADILTIRYVAERIASRYNARIKSVPWPEMAAKIESGDTIFDSSKLDTLLVVQYHSTFEKWAANLEVM